MRWAAHLCFLSLCFHVAPLSGGGQGCSFQGSPCAPASVLPPLPLPQPVASFWLPSPLLLTEALIHLTHGLPPRCGIHSKRHLFRSSLLPQDLKEYQARGGCSQLSGVSARPPSQAPRPCAPGVLALPVCRCTCPRLPPPEENKGPPPPKRLQARGLLCPRP